MTIKLKTLINEDSTSANRKEYTDFAKKLKLAVMKKLNMEISVTTSKTTTPNPYIRLDIPNWKVDFIPNDFRKNIMDIIFPNASVVDPNDIHYGNVRAEGITLRYTEWKQVYDKLFATPSELNTNKLNVGDDVIYLDNGGHEHHAKIESIPTKDQYIIIYDKKRKRVSKSELHTDHE